MPGIVGAGHPVALPNKLGTLTCPPGLREQSLGDLSRLAQEIEGQPEGR